MRRLCWDWHPVGDVATAVEEFLVDAKVRPWQRELTVPVLTPREPERRAGIVTLAPSPQDAGPLAASLANHGITVTVRSGLVRVAPHVGTGANTLRLFGDALAAFSSARVW